MKAKPARHVAELLSNTSQQLPDVAAVVSGDTSLTFQELDLLSNRIGRLLSGLGVQRGDRVGVLMEKSPQSIAAVLGILKAGAGYVPLPLTDPPARLGQIIADSGMRTAIVSAGQTKRLNSIQKNPLRHVLKFGPHVEATSTWQQYSWDMLNGSSERPLIPNIGRDDLAYVIYTSGSTGKPKGALVKHGGLLDLMNWADGYFGLTPGDCIAGVAPHQFDISVFDIFSTISTGATLLTVPPSVAAFPFRFAEFLAEASASFLFAVPSVLINLVNNGALDRHDLSGLRHIVFGGEFFPPEPLKKLAGHVPSATLHNVYGATEATVFSTCHSFVTVPDSAVHAGRAVAANEIHVTDEDGKHLPAGRVGEIRISGDAVMQGYCGRPEESEQVLTSLSEDDSKIAYRTGDRGFIDEDGNLHFTGRNDQMVKHRGFRIELPEIESVLSEHPDVGEAAAFCDSKDQPESVLWAAISGTATHSELAAHCARRLPQYMIPERILRFDELPHTVSGKVDRKDLLKERNRDSRTH